MNNDNRLELRSYLEDTDGFGVVHHSNHIKYFERGRTEWLRQRNVSLSELQAQGYVLVVSRLDVTYLKPILVDERLTVVTTLKKTKMSMAVFNQYIVAETGEVKSQATVDVVSLDRNKKLCHIANIINGG